MIVRFSVRVSLRFSVRVRLFLEKWFWLYLSNWYSCGFPARRLAFLGHCWDWLGWCQYTKKGRDSKFDLQLL